VIPKVLKARAPRKKVQLHGRMRTDYDWIDLSIRDLSKRGLMAEAENPPKRGHYIEIRRFDQVLVGRVVWQNGKKFGVVLADQIDFQAVIDGTANDRGNDRRNHATRNTDCRARIIDKPEDWRWLGQAFERVSVIGFGAGAVAMLGYLVFEALSRPMLALSMAIEP
jgi:hypothetical protein